MLDRLPNAQSSTAAKSPDTPSGDAATSSARQLNGVSFDIQVPAGWKYIEKSTQALIRRSDDGRLCQITTSSQFDLLGLQKETKGREVEFEREMLVEQLGMNVPQGLPVNISASGTLVHVERKEKSIRYAVRLKTTMSLQTKQSQGLALLATAARDKNMVRLQCMNITAPTDDGGQMEAMARSLVLK